MNVELGGNNSAIIIIGGVNCENTTAQSITNAQKILFTWFILLAINIVYLVYIVYCKCCLVGNLSAKYYY